MAAVGIPIKLLHESVGHTVTVEMQTGELYRGHLIHTEDNMNLLIAEVVVTRKDGKQTSLEQAYIRGSKIRYIVVPDNLRYAPMFKPRRQGAGSGWGSLNAPGAKGGKGKGGKGGKGKGRF